MSKKTLFLLQVSIFLLSIMLPEISYSTTFRVNAETDRSILINAADSGDSSGGQNSSDGGSSSGSGGGHGSRDPHSRAPLVSAEGVCLNCICDACHSEIATEDSAESTIDKHLSVYWAKNAYRPAAGEKVRILSKDVRDKKGKPDISPSFVVAEKEYLVLYEGKKRTVLSKRAKLVKTPLGYFVLE